jgi:hypothetical protein
MKSPIIAVLLLVLFSVSALADYCERYRDPHTGEIRYATASGEWCGHSDHDARFSDGVAALFVVFLTLVLICVAIAGFSSTEFK